MALVPVSKYKRIPGWDETYEWDDHTDLSDSQLITLELPFNTITYLNLSGNLIEKLPNMRVKNLNVSFNRITYMQDQTECEILIANGNPIRELPPLKKCKYIELDHTPISESQIIRIKDGQFYQFADSKRADEYLVDYSEDGLENACENGYLGLVKLILEKIDPFEDCLVKAARGGHISVVKYLTDTYDFDLEEPAKEACRNGHLDVVKILGVANDNLVKIASENGYYKCVSWLVNQGSNIDAILEPASKNGYNNLLKFALKRGAILPSSLAEHARQNCHLHTIDFLQTT